MPNVTVVGAWNNDDDHYRDEWFELSCESIAGQTFDLFRWVVGFYGDHGRDTLGRMEARHVPSPTLMEARNKIAASVDTEWMLVQDGDDVYEPTLLEELLRVAESSPDAVAVGALMHWIDEDGARIPGGTTERWRAETRLPWEEGDTSGYSPVTHPGSLIRMDAFRAAGGYDPSKLRGGDSDMFRRLAGIGPFAYVNKSLVGYRRHPGQTVKRHQQGAAVG